ncbi:hypothetical protein MRX96_009301 [Rhipicephalus microplus]
MSREVNAAAVSFPSDDGVNAIGNVARERCAQPIGTLMERRVWGSCLRPVAGRYWTESPRLQTVPAFVRVVSPIVVIAGRAFVQWLCSGE